MTDWPPEPQCSPWFASAIRVDPYAQVQLVAPSLALWIVQAILSGTAMGCLTVIARKKLLGFDSGVAVGGRTQTARELRYRPGSPNRTTEARVRGCAPGSRCESSSSPSDRRRSPIAGSRRGARPDLRRRRQGPLCGVCDIAIKCLLRMTAPTRFSRVSPLGPRRLITSVVALYASARGLLIGPGVGMALPVQPLSVMAKY